MEPAENIFKRKSYREKSLIEYGFVRDKDGFNYSALISDGQFKLTVNVCGRVIKTDVLELSLNEPFALYHIDSAGGAFVGGIRAEAEKILSDIADKCFYTEVFSSRQAKTVTDYVREKYGDEIEFLWEKFPDNAVFRRRDNQKWYGALLTVARQKLGLDGEGTIEVLDLREEPETLSALVDGKTYFAGYHMNKRHWLTVRLDGSVPDGELKERIDRSYILAKKK